jgi:predicted SAM-dependent methyltransferase
MSASTPHDSSKRPLKLHLGGWEVKEGWTIVNVEDRPGVDVRGDCQDLSMFADGSVSEIYASHVYEHLGYTHELPRAFNEAARVLMKGGVLRVAVPDLEVLCRLFLQTSGDLDAQFYVQRMIMGGQTEPFDFHKTGFSFSLLRGMLEHHGFREVRRVASFGLFDDTSNCTFGDVPISLNVQCMKP